MAGVDVGAFFPNRNPVGRNAPSQLHPLRPPKTAPAPEKVESIMGVARVNGDLAVSRAFGDAQHKQTGGPKQAGGRGGQLDLTGWSHVGHR